jgi:hypothetical protein
MLKRIVIALVATTMSVGLAEARMPATSSLTHAHFPTCAQGLVNRTLLSHLRWLLHAVDLHILPNKSMPRSAAGAALACRPDLSGDSGRSGVPRSPLVYHLPVFGMDSQGSFGGNGEPFCSSSIECLSGERTKAMVPSRGGRLMVTPAFISFSQSA